MSQPWWRNPHPDITQWTETPDDDLGMIWVEPTDRCNTRCLHCAHGYEQFGKDIDAELFDKIREQVLHKAQRVVLVGTGEPLMSEQFHPMFDECVRQGIAIETVTNGILLNNDAIVRKLLTHDVVLTISIDGVRPETFQFVRPNLKWSIMENALARLKRVSDELGSEKRARLQFSTVVMKQTIGDLTDLVRLAADHGFETIYVLMLAGTEHFEKLKDQGLDEIPEQVAAEYLRALKASVRRGVRLTVPSAIHEMLINGGRRRTGPIAALARWGRRARLGYLYIRRRGVAETAKKLLWGLGPRAKAGLTYCSVPWHSAYFGVRGDVRPCCITTEALGNLNESSWEEIWNGQLYRNLRRSIHSWNPTNCCRHCFYPSGINGGDDKQYARYFSKFRREDLPLDASGVAWGEGCHPLERDEDGRCHVWLKKTGEAVLPKPPDAKFLRLITSPRFPGNTINPGRAWIDGGPMEPFDNSCPDINLPLDHTHGRTTIRLRIEMEAIVQTDEDPRELSIPIMGLQYLI